MDQIAFILCVFGAVAAIGYFVAVKFTGLGEGEKLRNRLVPRESVLPGVATSQARVMPFLQRIGQAALIGHGQCFCLMLDVEIHNVLERRHRAIGRAHRADRGDAGGDRRDAARVLVPAARGAPADAVPDGQSDGDDRWAPGAARR